MEKIIVVVVLLFSVGGISAQSVVGKWKTIDDNSGKPRSIIEIFEKSGKVYGRVISIFFNPGEDQNAICDKCDPQDGRHNKKIIGMEIIRDLEKQGDEYTQGDILDPANGKVYRCRLWLEGKILHVRGYWGPFFRTQTWHRAE